MSLAKSRLGRKIFSMSLLSLLLLSACASAGGGALTSTPPISPTRNATNAVQASPTTGSVPAATATTAQSTATEAQAQPTTTQPAPTVTETAAEIAVDCVSGVSSLPDPAGYSWETLVSGLQRPLDFANPARWQRPPVCGRAARRDSDHGGPTAAA